MSLNPIGTAKDGKTQLNFLASRLVNPDGKQALRRIVRDQCTSPQLLIGVRNSFHGSWYMIAPVYSSQFRAAPPFAAFEHSVGLTKLPCGANELNGSHCVELEHFEVARNDKSSGDVLGELRSFVAP